MPVTTDEPISVPPGLRNVVVAATQLGEVRGEEGFYHYRGYPAIELARTRSLEEVWFLLVEGHLPSPAERARFTGEVGALRALPDELRPLLPAIARAGDRFQPMAGLRTALSLLAAERGLPALWDAGPARRRADALLVCAVTPTVLAALHRLRSGAQPLAPRADLPAAANYLYMLTGQPPGTERARALEQYLIAAIEHGTNSSAFAARVVASTGTDVVSAVTAALGALAGPLHGGAPDRALDTLDEIGTPDRIDHWVRTRVEAGDRIMGFGHAVYRTEDPRAVLLRETAERIGGELAEFATTAERRVVEILAELKPGRELHANVELYAGVVMELCGIPRVMFTPTFTVSRMIGWCANILEQADGGKLIRPTTRYTGPDAPRAVPPATPGHGR